MPKKEIVLALSKHTGRKGNTMHSKMRTDRTSTKYLQLVNNKIFEHPIEYPSALLFTNAFVSRDFYEATFGYISCCTDLSNYTARLTIQPQSLLSILEEVMCKQY